MPSFNYEYTEFKRLPNIRVFIVDLTHCHVHMHKEIEICLVLKGKAEVRHNNAKCAFGEGGLLVFNARQIHELHAVEAPSVMLLILQVYPAFCIKYFPEIDNVEFESMAVPEPAGARLRILLLSLALSYFGKDAYSAFTCVAYTSILFREILTSLPWKRISEGEKSSRQTAGMRLNRIVKHIEEHYADKLFLTDIAQRENLSLSYLSHFFRTHLEVSFQQYVSMLRFEKARMLLSRTDMSLTDVCVACGFQDCRQMRKVFLKQGGRDPSEYKKQLPEESGLYFVRPLNSVEYELTEQECADYLAALAADLPGTTV